MFRKYAYWFAVLLFAATLSAAPGYAQPKGQKKTDTANTDKKQPKLDINTVDKAELVKLPGIGPATADKIIQNRPYRAKSDLVKKKIIRQKEYDQIKDQIVATQVNTPAKVRGQ